MPPNSNIASPPQLSLNTITDDLKKMSDFLNTKPSKDTSAAHQNRKINACNEIRSFIVQNENIMDGMSTQSIRFLKDINTHKKISKSVLKTDNITKLLTDIGHTVTKINITLLQNPTYDENVNNSSVETKTDDNRYYQNLNDSTLKRDPSDQSAPPAIPPRPYNYKTNSDDIYANSSLEIDPDVSLNLNEPEPELEAGSGPGSEPELEAGSGSEPELEAGSGSEDENFYEPVAEPKDYKAISAEAMKDIISTWENANELVFQQHAVNELLSRLTDNNIQILRSDIIAQIKLLRKIITQNNHTNREISAKKLKDILSSVLAIKILIYAKQKKLDPIKTFHEHSFYRDGNSFKLLDAYITKCYEFCTKGGLNFSTYLSDIENITPMVKILQDQS